MDKIISSRVFINLIESLSGINDLIYDPTYYGGGTHNNLSGQGMDPHVDFNLLEVPGIGTLHRRLNVIIYLNENWEARWGGSLDIHSDPWDPKNNKIKSIMPSLNKMVMFETTEKSWHGFNAVSNELPEKISRKSIAIYYYTKDRPAEECAPKHGTFYVPQFPNFDVLHERNEISTEAYNELTSTRDHSLSLLERQYERECILSSYAKDREHEIEQLSN